VTKAGVDFVGWMCNLALVGRLLPRMLNCDSHQPILSLSSGSSTPLMMDEVD